MATTVQRKLTGLKHFNNEFESSLRELRTSGVLENGVEILGGKTTAEFKKTVDSSLKSVTDKIENDHKVRVAIAKSNTTTEIKVGDKSMTIMEALIYKQYQIPLLKSLLAKMVEQENFSRRKYADRIKEAEKQYHSLAATPNIDKSILENISDRNKPELFVLEKNIEKLRNDIEFFNREFDAALSEINSVTTIVV